MFKPLNDSLRKVARGTGIALIGMTSGVLFTFFTRLIIARYGLRANYGIFSLALVILNFAMLIASLGLRQGTTRYIAYLRGKDDATKVRATISASLKLATTASIIICLVLFFAAAPIAKSVFHTPDLVLPIRIFAVAIPFLTLINILAAVHRGFNRVEPQLYFQYITLNATFLIFLTIVSASNLPFTSVFYAYLTALIITFISMAIYTTRKLPREISLTTTQNPPPITKELLLFSLPLMGSTMLHMVVVWTDTLMLGYFKTTEVVGLYNAAYPLAQFIAEPLAALLLIYTPIATILYSQNLMTELRRNYTVVTKWLISLTLPIFLIVCLYPGAVLNLFFGSKYIAAANALQILSLGFIIANLLGPNGATLIALGHPRFIMWTNLAAAIMNIILNAIFIPPLGMVGAAMTSAVSIAFVNIVRSIRLYSVCKAQPFSKNLLKPLIISVLLAFVIQAVGYRFLTLNWWVLLILFVVYYVIYALATLFTRSFSKEDVALLLEIGKRSGINATLVKRILGRFL